MVDRVHLRASFLSRCAPSGGWLVGVNWCVEGQVARQLGLSAGFADWLREVRDRSDVRYLKMMGYLHGVHETIRGAVEHHDSRFLVDVLKDRMHSLDLSTLASTMTFSSLALLDLGSTESARAAHLP